MCKSMSSAVSVFGIGAVILGLALGVANMGQLLFQMSTSALAISAGPSLGVFSLGMFVPFGNTLVSINNIIHNSFIHSAPNISLSLYHSNHSDKAFCAQMMAVTSWKFHSQNIRLMLIVLLVSLDQNGGIGCPVNLERLRIYHFLNQN